MSSSSRTRAPSSRRRAPSSRRRTPSALPFTYAWLVKHPANVNTNNKDPHRAYAFKNNINPGNIQVYRPNINVYNRVRNTVAPALRRGGRNNPLLKAAVVQNLAGLGIPKKYLKIMITNVLRAREAAQLASKIAVWGNNPVPARQPHPGPERNAFLRYHQHQHKIGEWELLHRLVNQVPGANKPVRQPNRARNSEIYRALRAIQHTIPEYRR